MTKGQADANTKVASPKAATRRSASAADDEGQSTIPASTPRVRRGRVAAGKADDQPGKDPGNARTAGKPRAKAAVPAVRTAHRTSKHVVALVRNQLGPNQQVVYTLGVVDVLDAPRPREDFEQDLWADNSAVGVDLDEWTPQDKLTFAGIALFLVFIGFLIGKAF